MSAITINQNKSWVVARWVFEFLTEKLIASSNDSSTIKNMVAMSIKNRSHWFSLEDLEEKDRKMFYLLVQKIHEDLKNDGPSKHSTNEGFEALNRKIKELLDAMSHLS